MFTYIVVSIANVLLQINYVSEEIAKCPRLRTLRLESNCLSLDDIPVRLLTDSQVSLLALDGNVFEYKQLTELEGYDQVSEVLVVPRLLVFWCCLFSLEAVFVN